MISFFSRKNYLVDLLEGFTDIHNHILPGVDDGAQTVEESIALIKGFAEFGVSSFRMTPHIMHNYYDNNPSTIHKAKWVLEEELSKRGMSSIMFTAAAEHMIDSNFGSILRNKEIMPLGKEHLLIEMSYLQPPINFEEAVVAVTKDRLFPVLAHPERYSFLLNRPRKYGEFKEQGVLFQLNMLSLSDYYGKEVSRVAFKLLGEGMIDFIGSDVHNIHHLSRLKKLTLSKKTLNLFQPIIKRTIESFSI